MTAPLLTIATAAATIIAVFIAYMRYEAGAPVLETVRLTDEGDGLRVVQISDVHINFKTVPIAKVASLLREAAPRAIALKGDYINRPRDAAAFLTWMRGLIEAAAGADIYLCYGNHDAYAFLLSPRLKTELTKNLKRLGVHVLENRTSAFTHNGKQYAITGFSDYYAAAPRGDYKKAFKGVPANARYHIGLSHNPDIAPELSGTRPDLLLLGHFHGGQIWMPFSLEYICLRKEHMCKTGVRRGLYHYGGRLIYVSRGLGCVMFPLRLGSRPEITLFILP